MNDVALAGDVRPPIRIERLTAALDAIRRGAADTALLFGSSTSRIKARIQAATKAAGPEGEPPRADRIA